METVQLSFNRPGMASDAFYAKLNLSRRTEKICRAVSNQTCPEEKLSAGAGTTRSGNSQQQYSISTGKREHAFRVARQATYANKVMDIAEKVLISFIAEDRE